MIPIKTVHELINKHALLEKELSSGEIDKNSFAENQNIFISGITRNEEQIVYWQINKI